MERPPRKDATDILNDLNRRMRTIERHHHPIQTTLQVADEGTPLGLAETIDFRGLNIRASGDQQGYILVEVGGAAITFDAIVDETFIESDPANRMFRGIGEALDYLTGTIGLTRVGVMVRNGEYVETQNWTAPTKTFLFGVRGDNSDVTSGTTGDIRWDWNGFRPNGAGDLHIENFGQVEPKSGASSTPFSTIPIASLTGRNTYFILTHTGNTAALCTTGYFEACTLYFITNSSTQIRMADTYAAYVQPDIQQGPISSSTQNLVLAGTRLLVMGGRYQALAGTNNFLLPASADIELTYIKARQPTSTPTFICNISVAGSSRTKLMLHSETTGANQHLFDVTASSAFVSLEVYGECRAVVTGAHSSLLMSANLQSTWDITGPANLQTQLFGGATLLLRGEGIVATVGGDGITGGGSAGVIQFIGADRCIVVAALDGTGATGTKKAYTFDGTSDNNFLLLTQQGFPAAGTDAGSGNRIEEPPGSGPPAPDDADYLVGTAQAGLSNEIVVGATPGGELGGTWAAPTVDATHSGSAHSDFLLDSGYTANRVIFADASGNLTTDAGLTYDSATNVFTADKEVVVSDAGTRLVTLKSAFAGFGYIFGAVAVPSTTNYALAQGTAGNTFLNTAAGQNLLFLVAGGTKMTMSATTLTMTTKLHPSTPAAASQTAVGLYAGTGAPDNADGANGDLFFRSDGGALTTIYQRRAAVWVGVI